MLIANTGQIPFKLVIAAPPISTPSVVFIKGRYPSFFSEIISAVGITLRVLSLT